MDQADKKNLTLRIVSAFLLIPFTLWCVYSGGGVYGAFILLGWCICVHEWVKLSLKTKGRILLLLIGVAYISAAAYSFWGLAVLSYKPAFLMFFIAWASDILGYVFGKMIGGPKLIPAVSPNKTWAGFFGAVLGGVVVMVVFGLPYAVYSMPLWKFVIVLIVAGGLLGAVCQVGDLVVSALKRSAKTKDAGSLIPGHGGLLDRIDSLLLLSIVMFGLYAASLS